MAKNNNLKDFLTDVADAIREKKGTTEPINPQNFSSEIASIEGSGGGDIEEAPIRLVNFIDYDGTVIYSYNSYEEYNGVPPFPKREGLIAQSWAAGLLTIPSKLKNKESFIAGCSYITDDGKTRLYIRIASEAVMDVSIRFNQSIAKGVGVDWGDGSEVGYFNGTGNVGMNHAYSKIGDYVITLSPSDDCTLSLGNGSSSYCVMGPTANTTKICSSMLRKVEIGKNVSSISNYAFYGCFNLESVTIPYQVTSIGNYAFYDCLSLQSITIPYYVDSIGTYAFSGCSTLKIASINGLSEYSNYIFYQCKSLLLADFSSVKKIGNYAFYNCVSLTESCMNKNLITIGNNAFYTCYGMRYYDFSKHTSIPTLSGTSVFNGITTNCKIIVPDDLYDSWKAATNWSSHTSKIIKKSDWDASRA